MAEGEMKVNAKFNIIKKCLNTTKENIKGRVN